MERITKHKYGPVAVEAAKRVMIELIRLLGEYQNDIVIIGGWVPDLLMPGQGHIGSTDIDIALDHRVLQDPGYESIRRRLIGRGYTQDERQPFIFWRTVNIKETEVVVEVDLLAAEYEGTGRKHRTQKVQDIRARTVRGCDLALEKPVELKLTGETPSGGIDTVSVRVAAIVPFLVMKSMSLRSRIKEKDSYDIWLCLRYYPDVSTGIEVIAGEFQPYLENRLVSEALEILDGKFAST
ncbi:MAG: hypothetical protein ACC655_11270, partial [Rhodothermia bacterium]